MKGVVESGTIAEMDSVTAWATIGENRCVVEYFAINDLLFLQFAAFAKLPCLRYPGYMS